MSDPREHVPFVAQPGPPAATCQACAVEIHAHPLPKTCPRCHAALEGTAPAPGLPRPPVAIDSRQQHTADRRRKRPR